MIPKYMRLSNILREQVKNFSLKGIEKLPTEKSLCEKYGVSRQTVREALSLLEKENLIYKKQGSGIFVNYQAFSGHEKKIALLVSTDNEYIFPSIIRNLRLAFEKNGYAMDVLIHNGSYVLERQLLNEIKNENYSGIIVQPVKSALPSPNSDIYEDLKDKDVLILFMWEIYPNLSSFPCIQADDVFGGYMAGKHLIDNGHSHITLFMNRDDASGLNRYRGLLMALNDANLPIKDNLAYWYYDDDIAGLHLKHDISFIQNFIHTLLTCTAVVCHNDEVAYWLIKELEKSGIKVPEDLSVISFDNSYLSDFASSHITSFSHNKGELEKRICECMLNMIFHKDFSSAALSWKLVKRNSDSSI